MFFLLRVGIITAALALVYFWELRPRPLARRWPALGAPMARFGRASLFVYWVHVELVYGIFSGPLHRNLSFGMTLLALAAFSAFMYALVLLKDRVVAAWQARRPAIAPSRASVEKA